MSHIFTSYSRRDTEIVIKFVDALAGAGMDIWLDREDIKAGNSWRVQIVEAIDTCDAFVLMLSNNSAASTNVHKEVILAADSNRALFVVMLEPVKVPPQIRYQLAGLQFIEFHTLGFDKAAEHLISALQAHLKKIRPKGEDSHKQTELVIQGIDISAFTAEKQEQLLAFVASLANTSASQLSIANMTAGSIHIFMDMPAAAAYQLKALALNGDRRFKKQNIVSLRIAGDTLFVHTAQGTLDPSPKSKTFFSSLTGKIIAFSVAAIIIAAIGISSLSRTPSPMPDSAPPPASDSADAESVNPNLPSPTKTATATQTSTPTITPSPTITPVAYKTLNGVISSERAACNYGPGDLYLNDETLRQGIKLQALGRDINSGWAYVQADGYASRCWVNLEYITLDGEVEALEPVYPGKVALPPSSVWSPPKNVYTVRSKSDSDKLSIYWDALILEDGDLEKPGAPRYLLELWLCKDGELVFTPTFAWENSIVVEDEAGCSEPSGGFIYLSEKHGYPGPVTISWTPHP